MFQLLDKLAKYGGAENIAFDWWRPGDDKDDTDEEQVDEDKSRVQQILLTLCYKVRDQNVSYTPYHKGHMPFFACSISKFMQKKACTLKKYTVMGGIFQKMHNIAYKL